MRRYDSLLSIYTQRDPLDDYQSWLLAMKSVDVVQDYAREFRSTQMKRSEANVVASHVRLGLEHLHEARESKTNVAFLPLYYSFLSLAKACIAFDGRGADLESQRYHGANYSGIRKRSRGLATDEIKFQKNGAIGLFYSVLTKKRWPQRPRPIRAAAIFPLLEATTWEAETFLRLPRRLFPTRVSTVDAGDGARPYLDVTIEVDGGEQLKPGHVRIAAGLSAVPGQPNHFIRYGRSTSECESWVNKCSFYGDGMSVVSPVGMVLPEEIPLLLATFLMSNLVRYNPELLYRIEMGREGAFLDALRRNAPLSFLSLICSFIMQKRLVISTSRV